MKRHSGPIGFTWWGLKLLYCGLATLGGLLQGPAALHVHSGRPLAHVLPASSAITRTTSISDKYGWIPLINHENPTRISVFKIAPSGDGKKSTDLMFWAVFIIHVHMKSGPLHTEFFCWWMMTRKRRLLISSLLGSSFPRNPLTYQKGGFLEILFLGAGLIHSTSYYIIICVVCNDVCTDCTFVLHCVSHEV